MSEDNSKGWGNYLQPKKGEWFITETNNIGVVTAINKTTGKRYVRLFVLKGGRLSSPLNGELRGAHPAKVIPKDVAQNLIQLIKE